MVWIGNLKTQSFEECIRWFGWGSSFSFFGRSSVYFVTLFSSFSWSAQEASSCCILSYRKEQRLLTQHRENHTGFHSEMLSGSYFTDGWRISGMISNVFLMEEPNHPAFFAAAWWACFSILPTFSHPSVLPSPLNFNSCFLLSLFSKGKHQAWKNSLFLFLLYIHCSLYSPSLYFSSLFSFLKYLMKAYFILATKME